MIALTKRSKKFYSLPKKEQKRRLIEFFNRVRHKASKDGCKFFMSFLVYFFHSLGVNICSTLVVLENLLTESLVRHTQRFNFLIGWHHNFLAHMFVLFLMYWHAHINTPLTHPPTYTQVVRTIIMFMEALSCSYFTNRFLSSRICLD